jgi:2-polyprenyl-6-methoxyphenol hydroxylase-like FAD-dependent oxidoreductase
MRIKSKFSTRSEKREVKIEECEVIQIGYGPVGQVSAALLGQQGLTVSVFERWQSLYALPRAGHIDHEIMRTLQGLGCAARFEEDAFRMTKYTWRNAAGETLMTFDWDQEGVSGWPSDYLFYQPHLEDTIDRAVKSQSSVQVHHGWEAIEIVQSNDYVEVTLRQVVGGSGGRFAPTGQTRRVRGQYLIGADGANSFVRRSLGMAFQDLGFRENWLVMDFKQKRPVRLDFDNGQICDPARPLCLFQLGKRHRRFECMVMPGDTPEELADPGKAWELVGPWISPDDAELIRQAVYTFESKLLDRWIEGRVIIIGDAAHLMPPFIGQGMCSGIRDAKNLAWKLALVLRGVAPRSLLETYPIERKPHVAAVIDLAVQVGKVSCTVDPAVAVARDEAFRTGKVPPPQPFPHLTSGLFQRTENQGLLALRGNLTHQGRVRAGNSIGLCDDVIGSGWQLITTADARSHLSNDDFAFLESIGTKFVCVSSEQIVDVDSTYQRYLKASGCEVILGRPDFYAFGGATSMAELPQLIRDLRDQLTSTEWGAS